MTRATLTAAFTLCAFGCAERVATTTLDQPLPRPDLTVSAASASELPEEYFMHFSEDTSTEGTALLSARGCPIGQRMQPSCRVSFYAGNELFFLLNLSSPQAQEWNAERLERLPKPIDFEPVRGFVFSYGFAGSAHLVRGGGIRELYGLRPDHFDGALDRAYNQMVIDWRTNYAKRGLVRGSHHAPMLRAQLAALDSSLQRVSRAQRDRFSGLLQRSVALRKRK
jgi:hypothetical protein